MATVMAWKTAIRMAITMLGRKQEVNDLTTELVLCIEYPFVPVGTKAPRKAHCTDSVGV